MRIREKVEPYGNAKKLEFAKWASNSEWRELVRYNLHEHNLHARKCIPVCTKIGLRHDGVRTLILPGRLLLLCLSRIELDIEIRDI